jgi:dUTP pyrophosphatase
VIIINLSNDDCVLNDGERIAQMVINKVEQAEWVITEALNETARGAGGFGHTGK